jgi:long-chain acyl-CoA synthetase
MTNAYDARPWHGLYDAGQKRDMVPDHTDALALFRAAVARAPERPALRYFDGTLSYAALDRLSDGLACRLRAAGFARGDRLGIYLQNVPHFPLALLAAWKAGGIAVAINPMNRARELTNLLEDSTPRALICQDTLYAEVVAGLPARPALCLTVSARDFQTRDDPRLFAGPPPALPEGAEDLLTAIARHAGEAPPPAAFTPDETAMLVYTSGTTGVPKGAMCTHGNVAFNAQTYRDWIGLCEGEPILGLAPLFHITGLIGHIVAAFLTASPLILTYRFEPAVMLEAIAEHRPRFTIGAITAFIALMNHPAAKGPEAFESLRVIYTGGAPVPARVVEEFAARFGQYIHNGYGLTETNSPTHVVPRGRGAPGGGPAGGF